MILTFLATRSTYERRGPLEQASNLETQLLLVVLAAFALQEAVHPLNFVAKMGLTASPKARLLVVRYVQAIKDFQ